MHLFSKIKFVIVILICFQSTFSEGQTNSKFKITLDAGHGGKDFGAVYNGRIEKNVALAVVLKVGKILENQSSISVNYTRKTDVFIDLIERANIANRVDANIFVSIHCNANKNLAADGTETYVMGMTKNASSLAVAKAENEVVTMEKDYKQKYKGFDPKSPETMIGLTVLQEEYIENSIALASKVENAFETIGKKIRAGGVKQAPYMVLHKAAMPRILIEMGFISNPNEGTKLESDEGQTEIAQAIATAILSYKKEYFGSNEIIEEKHKNKDEKTTTEVIKPEIKNSEKPKTNQVENEKKNSEGEITYKIQLSTGTKKIATKPSNFKGLKDIEIENENKLYKYFYGNTSNYEEIKTLLKDVKSKGYSTAFIITLKDGKRIK